MSLDKAKTIVKAFLEPLPVHEKWYQERLAKCEVCPLNSKNKKKLSLADKLNIANLVKKGICDSGDHCTACGCCIERKCATRTEDCGKVKIGETPEWKALDIQSEVNKNISLINMSPTVGEISVSKKEFTYDFGENDSAKLEFRFRVNRKDGKFDLKAYRPGCSCTSVDDVIKIDDNTTEFLVSVSTNSFRKGWNERKLYITHFINPRKLEEIVINMKVNKPNGKQGKL